MVAVVVAVVMAVVVAAVVVTLTFDFCLFFKYCEAVLASQVKSSS